MAKGYDQHQERLQALSLLGKELARRAKSKCELSGRAGVSLRPYEVEPAPKESSLGHCLLIADEVREVLERPSKMQASEWRGQLSELIWSELPAQQVMVCRMLQYLALENPWAQNVIDEAYLDEEVLEWANQAPLGK
ncbi:phnA protein [Rubritalea tangerina]|uniref:PhnA protein n=1 Tax=Rubritalea tangerina TaxID=430798 RepID=A0ABW4Z8E8_9BACT